MILKALVILPGVLALLVQVGWMRSQVAVTPPRQAQGPEHKFHAGLEYFDRRPARVRHTVLAVHGLGGTGDVFRRIGDPDHVLETSGTRLLSVSMPGFGLSEPLGPDEREKSAALRRMSEAFVAILNHEEVEQFYIIGISTGAMPALFTASREPERCLGAASLVGAVWTHDEFNLRDNPKKAAVLALMDGLWAVDYIQFPLTAYVTRHIGSPKLFLPNDYELLAKDTNGSDYLRLLDEDFERSMSVNIHGNMHAISWLFSRMHQPGPLMHWEDLESVPVTVAYAQDDYAVPARSTALQREKIPHAHMMPFKGGHMHFLPNFFKVLSVLLSNKKTKKSASQGAAKDSKLAKLSADAAIGMRAFSQYILEAAQQKLGEEAFVTASKDMAFKVKDVLEHLLSLNRNDLVHELKQGMVNILMSAQKATALDEDEATRMQTVIEAYAAKLDQLPSLIV